MHRKPPSPGRIRAACRRGKVFAAAAVWHTCHGRSAAGNVFHATLQNVDRMGDRWVDGFTFNNRPWVGRFENAVSSLDRKHPGESGPIKWTVPPSPQPSIYCATVCPLATRTLKTPSPLQPSSLSIANVAGGIHPRRPTPRTHSHPPHPIPV